MREVPKKNYFILFGLFVAVVLLDLVLINFYNNNNKVVNDSEMKKLLNIIKCDEIDIHVSEFPNAVIYINDSTIENTELEKKLKEIINENNISQHFIYVERTKDVEKKYNLDDNNPIFIAYKDGKVKEIYSKSEYKLDEIEGFLVRNEFLDND